MHTITLVLKLLAKLRRFILRTFVPELFWREYILMDGVKIKIKNQPYSFGVKLDLQRGTYEKMERALTARFLKPGHQVIEFGSSLGILSAIMSNRIGATGRLVSVEASPVLAASAKSTLHGYPQTEVIAGYGFPVWKLPRNFQVTGFDDTNGSLGGRVSFVRGSSCDPNQSHSERVWDLSKICSFFEIVPEVLVCDIEGAESVLIDIEPMWPASVTDVVIEIHPTKLKGKLKDAEAIRQRIETTGFFLKEKHGDTFWFSRR